MQELNFPRQTSMERTASHNHAAVEAGIPESIPEALQLQVTICVLYMHAVHAYNFTLNPINCGHYVHAS